MIDNGQAPAGATAIVAALAGAGTRVMFGVPGGGPNLDVVGAATAAGLRFVLTHTETAAVIMAASYADLTGRPGAAVVTRGPGLASAVNGIAHATLDRLPVVVIADTVRSADADRVSHQRLDQAALGASVAKAVVTVGQDMTGDAAAEAIRLALEPPAGPVVALMDDSGAPAGPMPGGPGPGGPVPGGGGRRDLAVLDRALRASRWPVILLGTEAIAHTAAIRASLNDLDPTFKRLLDEPVTAVVAVMGRDEHPNLTPVWFDYEGDTVLLNLATHRKKVDWLRKAPYATFLLMNPENTYHWISIKTVLKREISEDDPVEGQRVTDQLDRIWVKYTGNEPPYALRDPSMDERRVLFEMEVVKVATFGRP